MKIFVVATRDPDKPAEDFAPLMDPEADYALKLYIAWEDGNGL